MLSEPVFLYVEDDENSREVMEMLLKYRLGYSKLTIFEDSANFMRRLEALSPTPNVIFLDIHIKPHDGFDLLKMLRTNPRYADTIIITVTASVMNEEVDALRSANFDGVISKPIDPDTFPDLIAAILQGQKVWQVSS